MNHKNDDVRGQVEGNIPADDDALEGQDVKMRGESGGAAGENYEL